MGKLAMDTQTIQEYNQRDWVLKRPTALGGDFSVKTEREFYFGDDGIAYGDCTYSSGLAKLFDEAITNATDNYQRCPKLKDAIEINIYPDHFTIKNFGPSLDIAKQLSTDGKEYYIPEITFSHFNSSSNYNDDEVRMANGQNGVGIKLTNVFSTRFEVCVVNKGTKYVQVFTDNMGTIHSPTISKTRERDSVMITSYPDFERLGITSITDGNLYHLKMRAYSCVIFGRAIVMNGVEYKGMNFINFASQMACVYLDRIDTTEHYAFETSEASVLAYVVASRPNQFSFVNNIYTSNNGTHVNNFIKQLTDAVNDTKAKRVLNPKQYLLLFINQHISQPQFDGQAKNRLTSSIKTQFTSIIRGLRESEQLHNLMINKTLKAGSKGVGKTFYRKCQPANKAGTKESSKCTLFITEGDSATGMVNKGFGVLSHDYYGVFTLRGKVLNVVKAMPTRVKTLADPMPKVDANEIVCQLLKEIGLQRGIDYSSKKGLRYGRIVMVKDADVDGDAIMGLVYNIFYTFFRKLLMIDLNSDEQPFFYEFTTPAFQIILKKLKDGQRGFNYAANEKLEFTTEQALNTCKLELGDKEIENIHYMKGLGAIDDDDVKRYFKSIHTHLIPITIDDPELTEQYMTMVYGKGVQNIEARKQWVMSCDPKLVLERAEGMKEMTITAFQHYSNIHFAVDDCSRSMVNVVDGLKPSHRKILYTLFNTSNSTRFQKVTSLSGEVTKFGKYMHGEASLEETIFGMMRNWAGSNNIALLKNRGGIGCRLDLGKNHAQPRYVETALNDIARYVYVKDDDPILTPTIEEGEPAEPEYYVPIVPITLINGCEGIGTGFSTFIPNHNPYDCIDYIIDTLRKDKNQKQLTEFSQLHIRPYYPECHADVQEIERGYVSYGSQEWIFPNTSDSSDKFWDTCLMKGRTGTSPLDYNPCFLKITSIPIGVNKYAKMDEIKDYLASKYGKKSSSTSVSPAPDTSLTDDTTEPDEDKSVRNIKKTCWPKLIDMIDNCADGTQVQYEKVELIFKIDNAEKLPENFQIIPMVKTLYLTNMHAFDSTGRITKYDSVEQIMHEFMRVRFDYYMKRKSRMVQLLTNDVLKIANRARFIKFKVRGLNNAVGLDHKSFNTPLDTRGMHILDLIKIMELNGFNKYAKMDGKEQFYKSSSNNGTYDYILDYITTRKETIEEYNRLMTEVQKVKTVLKEYQAKTVADLWISDLNVLREKLMEIDEINKERKDKDLAEKMDELKQSSKPSIRRRPRQLAKTK